MSEIAEQAHGTAALKRNYNHDYWAGFTDGSKVAAVTVKEPCYLGHDTQYWVDYAIGYLPALVFFIVFILLLLKGRKRQAALLSTYEASVQRQQEALNELVKSNQILAEISQKIDARRDV